MPPRRRLVLHQLFGDDDPVFRGRHRAAHAAHTGDVIERRAHVFSNQRRP